MLDRRLNYVVAVVQYGSFTKAAEKAGVTQSGITKGVADLERELGYALFHRTARGAMLTEAGREFAERAARLLEDARSLLAGSRERSDPFARPLRIGICPTSLEWLLSAPLSALLARHPSIRFDLMGSTFDRVIQLLRTGAVDVAFGFEDAFAGWSEVRLQRIASLHAVLFVRKGHPILCGARNLPLDLTGFDFVVPSDSRPYSGIIRKLFEDAVVPLWQRRLHVIDYFPTVKRIVATSDAIGVTTQEYAGSAAFAASFERVPGGSPFPPAPMCCAVRSSWEPAPPVKAFLHIMQEWIPV